MTDLQFYVDFTSTTYVKQSGKFPTWRTIYLYKLYKVFNKFLINNMVHYSQALIEQKWVLKGNRNSIIYV